MSHSMRHRSRPARLMRPHQPRRRASGLVGFRRLSSRVEHGRDRGRPIATPRRRAAAGTASGMSVGATPNSENGRAPLQRGVKPGRASRHQDPEKASTCSDAQRGPVARASAKEVRVARAAHSLAPCASCRPLSCLRHVPWHALRSASPCPVQLGRRLPLPLCARRGRARAQGDSSDEATRD